MRLWQLYVATIMAATLAVAGLFWLGALVQEVRASGDKRVDCAIWSNKADPDDPRCPHK